MISTVVPVYNEKENIEELLKRLSKALSECRENYEIICIDDNSNDGTWSLLKKLSSKYPLKIFKKEGKKGKAYSLYEGFNKASGEKLVMIDADLQYPPEAIPGMIELLERHDIVVASRKNYKDSKLRKVLSKTFNLAFARLLHGVQGDSQSGLKVFKKGVFEVIKFAPKSPWTFDLEFLLRAKEAGFEGIGYDITFNRRKKGASKINTLKATYEIGTNALLLKAKGIKPMHIASSEKDSMLGAGVGFKKKKYVTHTTLHHSESALKNFVSWQKWGIGLTITAAAAAFYFFPQNTAVVIVAILSAIYFLDVLFNLFLILKSLHSPPELKFEEKELGSLKDKDLPIYSVLSPLYKEAHVLPNFLQSIKNLDWPKEKLDVILLLEEDDKETQEAAKNLDLPSYVRTIVVPHSAPKTKPKACNYGLAHAKGEYLVIYDAEDIPDPLQLKKAYLGFQKSPGNVACLQAKLNYHNSHQNLLTRFFTAEYSLWFDVTLTGLQSIGTTIPLGGTSNHFRTKDLIELKGWDPFNVTEDADLGVRLFKKGFRTAIIDSTTLEEANSRLGNWVRQRSRWIKGYMQTYLVHMRNPLTLAKKQGIHAIIFQLVLGGKIAFMFINPFLWAATIAYFALRSAIGPAIEALYPAPVFYMALTSLVFGNFLFMYYYMIGCAQRQQWSLIKYVLLVPFYWLSISFAATIALYQLIVKPHYWEKTVHGLHLAKFKKDEDVPTRLDIPIPTPAFARGIFASGTMLVAASLFANFFNFLYNAYLGRRLAVEDFGLVSLVASFLYLSTVPVAALGKTVTHRSAFLFGKYETPAREFWKLVRKRAFLVGALITFVWVIGAPYLSGYFKAPSLEPFYLFAPAWIVGLILAVDSGFLSGNLKFKTIAVITFIEPLLRMAVTFILVETGLSHLVYAATPFSMVFSLTIAANFASKIKQEKEVKNKIAATAFPVHFFASAILTRISIFAFLSFDLILAKHFLSPTEAGQYALISLVGKMIFFVSSLFTQFMNPLVSKADGEEKETKPIFYKLLAASTLTSLGAFLFVGYFGYLTVPILLGEKIIPVLGYLPIYSFAMFAFSIASTVVLYYQVRRKYLFSFISFALALTQIVGIYLYHSSLGEIINVMAVTGTGSLVVIFALHLVYQPFANIARNTRDFLDLLFAPVSGEQNNAGLNILIFNWRDTKHVWSGGAEVYIHELSKELIKKGNNVTLFCGNDGKNPRHNIIDGVQVIRRGGFYTVYAWAFLYYIFRFRNKFDIIIDSENGIPFFTPIYVRKPIIGLVHHVHQEVFRRHLSFPFAQIAQFLEGKLMPYVYRNTKLITVSKSSLEDMQKIGLGEKFKIDIIHPGVNLDQFKPKTKTKEPSIIYLGRLKPYKSIETAIEAIEILKKNIKNISLTIVGEGESRPALENLVVEKGLQDSVKFTGKIAENLKPDLLAKSWVMVHPSTMEGWGITAIEANASGTPVVASNVPGLRDSVQNPHSGFLVPVKDAQKFANKIELIIKNEKVRKELEEGGLAWARKFSWETSASDLMQIIELQVGKRINS